MRRVLLLIVVLACCSAPAYCEKVGVAFAVSFEQSSTMKAEMEQEIKARINGTDRYSIVSDLAGSLVLDISCIKNQSVEGATRGLTCSSELIYYPFTSSLISIPLTSGETIVTAGNDGIEYIARNIVNAMINATTETDLKNASDLMMLNVTALASRLPFLCEEKKK